MARVRAVDWSARHTPISGTMNAAYTALSVAAVGSQTGLPGSWAMGASTVGALGSAISGASREVPLSKGSIGLRVAAWLSGGAWTSYALSQDNVWEWGVLGPLLAAACGFGAAAGGLAIKHLRDERRRQDAHNALMRVKVAREWIARIERVAGIKGADVINVEDWKDQHTGRKTGAGYDIEVRLPEGGATWRSLQQYTDGFAADARLPEGCGVEVFCGADRGLAIMKVSTKNSLLETIDVPHDASPLSFEESFDIGVLRDSTLAMINIREFSAMLVGAKRTGKTNELLTIMTRLLRMPNLRIWVIDFNGGGVALQWLRAWNDLGRPGRPPIDWVASEPREAAAMANAAVRIAKARKTGYTKLMAEANTDLLPMTADLPGIVIVTDEGAEVYANPKHSAVSEPMKEVLRIAGASGVNQINCFLRATADVTGDTLIKSQSRALIGMMMSNEDELAYLLGWKNGVKPEDMPERGYGAVSMDPSGPASVFRGYRTRPNDITWFVENTVQYRRNESLDQVSAEAAGEIYATRWAEDRAGHLFDGSAPKVTADATTGPSAAAGGGGANEGTEDAAWSNRPALAPGEASANLKKAIEDADAAKAAEQEDELDPFEKVLREAGVADPTDPSTWPDGVKPEPPADPDEPDEEETEENMAAVVFGLVKAMTPKGGMSVQMIRDSIKEIYGEDAVPTRQTITRWLREDDRIHKPSGFKHYEVKPEFM